MDARGERHDGNTFWDAAGPVFVAALNDGLARAGHPTLRPRGGGRPVSRPQELPHPFAAAVMRAYETALPAALAVEEEGDRVSQAALRRRGREVLAAALGLPGPRGPRPACRTAGSPLPRYENLVVTLLMESAALVLSERPEVGGTDGRPAALVRALGRSARSGGAGG
ncbi:MULTISPECIES: hypothetical protein [unclassified Streptomyces]|uniref:hypothetical protein n=1 Tax=unclassified Streptomyces TaxID=2593676 RepID=UPI0006AE09A9|nr:MULTISPECIES: hypothetical protein [unclassified Streptomyces]